MIEHSFKICGRAVRVAAKLLRWLRERETGSRYPQAGLEAAYADSRGLWTEIYVNKELKWDKVTVRCRIAERPFLNPPRRRATPAPDYRTAYRQES